MPARLKPSASRFSRDALLARRGELAERLGVWFDKERRDLPWRKNRNAYAVWLSEVMLQQTRVKTVVEYFPRFLRRYPDVKSLATANLDDVLSAWSGLGYYRRARALHEGAREVVARYGGKVPATVDELRTIPGVGAYTAGAIASIAFGVRAPLVDGNVARVIARIFAVGLAVRTPAGMRAMWELATELVPAQNAGRHNEALMELGAVVCTPQNPRCDACPVRTLCKAFGSGRQGELPIVAKKKPPRAMELAAVVMERGDRLLLGKRRADGLFGGMWEPPMVEIGPKGGHDEAFVKLLGRSPASLALLGYETRVLTHRKFRIAVFAGHWDRGALPRALSDGPYELWAWLRRDELLGRGVSTMARTVLARADRHPADA